MHPRRHPTAQSQELEAIVLVAIVFVVVSVALIIAAVFLFIPRGGSGAARVESTRTDALTMQGAVEGYISEHPGTCPSVADLLADGIITRSHRSVDGWERPFRIRCVGDAAEVTSAGPDGRFDTADDLH